MFERYAHVPVPDDVISVDSRSAVLMVARELVRAHRARGLDAHLVSSARAFEPGAIEEPVLPILRGQVHHGLTARAWNLLEGRVLGHRPMFAAGYRGLETLTDADVIVVHNRPEGLHAISPSAFRVLYLHNDALRHYSRRELGRLIPLTDLLVCVSQALADQVPEEFDVPRSVVLNGVDTNVFRPCDGGSGDAPPTIMFCGRIMSIKGVHLLIEALATLRDRPFRARILGAGTSGAHLSSYERGLRSAVARHHLDDRVSFERSLPRSAVPEAMRQSDILVVPSTWPDPCPLVLLEGLASGLAIVGSRTGGIPELGGTAARYFEPGDVDGMAEQLDILLRDALLRRAHGEAARERALNLTWAAAERQLTRDIAVHAAT